MGFLDRLKELLKKNNDEFNFEYEEDIQVQPISQSTAYQPLDLPNGELVSFTDEVLDTNSRESIDKFKHNLATLAKKIKETGLDQVTTQLSTELIYNKYTTWSYIRY